MMNKEIAPWTAFIVERAARGPVTYAEMLVSAAALVPPGRAYRDATSHVLLKRESGGHVERHYVDQEHMKDVRIRLGQRSIAAKAIQVLSRRKRIEKYDLDGVAMLRKGPRSIGEMPLVSSRLAESTKAMLRSVKDGPVLVEDVLDSVYHLVPRQTAIDKARRNRHRIDRERGRPHSESKDDDHDFRVGARQYVHPGLASQVRARRLAVFGKGPSALLLKGPLWVDLDAEQ